MNIKMPAGRPVLVETFTGKYANISWTGSLTLSITPHIYTNKAEAAARLRKFQQQAVQVAASAKAKADTAKANFSATEAKVKKVSDEIAAAKKLPKLDRERRLMRLEPKLRELKTELGNHSFEYKTYSKQTNAQYINTIRHAVITATLI
jgi:hypothetical protein